MRIHFVEHLQLLRGRLPSQTTCLGPTHASRWIVLGLAISLVFGSPTFAEINVSVSVDAGSTLSTMSPLGLGMHTSPYYNSLTHSSMDNRLEEAGVTTLRYGGGGYADVLHWSIARPQWESGVTGGGLSPWWGQSSNFGYVGPGSDFASFAGLLDQVESGQAVVTVNYGSALKLVGGQSQVPDFGGQPKEAAAWVAYANADPSIYGTINDIAIGVDQQGNDWKTAGYWAKLRASTSSEFQSWASSDGVYDPLNAFLAINRDSPIGIKYWEIGNETFGTGYYGGGDGYSVDYDVPYDGTNRDDHAELSPAQYGQEVVEYAQLMKSIDPTIKVGAVLATPPDDYSWSYADLNDNGFKNSNEAYWNDEVLSQPGISDNVDFVMVHWYPWAGNNSDGSSLLSQVGSKIPQMINGSTPGQDSGTNAGIRDSLALHGLPNAEVMITEFRYNGSINSSLEDAAESIFVADAFASWLELGVSSVQYLELLTNKGFLTDDGSLTRGPAFYGVSMIDKLVEPGEVFVDAASSDSDIRVHAALQDDGSIAFMLLNLNPSESANVTVDIEGVSLEATGTKFELTDGLNLSESSVESLGNSFSVSLPARSIAVYLIAKDESGILGDFDGDGDVDGNDFLKWQRDELSQIDLNSWKNNYGFPFSVAAVLVPEPTTLVLASSLIAAILMRTPLRP